MRKQTIFILFPILFFLFVSAPFLRSQTPVSTDAILSGKIVDSESNEALPSATVFINNTTYGTTANEKGEFSLRVKAGKFELVVSMVGYDPVVHLIDTEKLPKSFLVKLKSSENLLQSVTVNAKRDEEWYQNLKIFKENFLGKSEVAQKCELLNPEALIIVFDPQTAVLEVKATEILKINNPALGYKLSYLLQSFRYDMRSGYLTYMGFPHFQNLKSSRLSNRTKRNRIRAYNGSLMHFVRSARERKLEEDGFNLRRLIRKPNPQRPSDAEISQAREQLRSRASGIRLDPTDPASVIISKAGLPKIVETLDTTRVPYKTYLFDDGHNTIMKYEGYFQVVYAREKEEMGFVQSTSPLGKVRTPTWQTSVISLLRAESILLEPAGNIVEPLDVLLEGYWGWEKIGDLLPLDFDPAKGS